MANCYFPRRVGFLCPDFCIIHLFIDSFFFFDVDHFFKVFIEFVTKLLLFYVLVFWSRGMWDLSSLPGIEPTTPALEGEV